MWAMGWLIWEESHSVFTRRGVVGDGIGDAAQAAWVPMRHIVKEVSSVFGVTWFEYLFLSTDGEPLGAPRL